MTKKILILVSLFFTLIFQFLQAQQLEIDTTMWVTNGAVTEIVKSGNNIYIAGNFTHVGPNTGSGVVLNQSDGRVRSSPLLKVNATVRVAISDGRGGWFIGGDFTRVGGVERNRIAHILADGTLDATWNPNASSRINALAVSGNLVYVGGSFTHISGQLRSGLAALDATTGQATAWNPNASGEEVQSLAVLENIVYVGGIFTHIGGQPRNNVVALDATTGQATAWHPNVNGRVLALTVSEDVVYMGGEFSSIGGQTRNHLAAFDTATGQLTPWNPNASGIIQSLAVSEDVVYVGGMFSSIGGQLRNNVAALDATTGQATPWNPNVGGRVTALAVSEDVVYVGGYFTFISGQTRNNIAAINATTGQLTPWNPNASDYVHAVAISEDVVYVGGTFTSIGGQTRNNLAALDATTGQATPWNPNPNGAIWALAMSGNMVYVGGGFTMIGGQTRNYLAALDAATGQATPWNPNVDSSVYTLAVSGNTVYVGGWFRSIGGQTRNNLAALDAATGQATPWNPNPNEKVHAIAMSGNTIYVGGNFTFIGGQTRIGLAALDAATGQLTPWNPNPNNAIYNGGIQNLSVSTNTVYVGGSFTFIGGQTRMDLAALDATTGQATPWNPNPNPNEKVLALAVSGNTIYVGGGFTSIGGQTRNYLAALDAATGQATPWNPNPNYQIYALAVSANTVYVGGGFRSIDGGQTISYFAAFGRPVVLPNFIKGNIYEDTNGDCVKNGEEKGVANRVVVAQPGNYFASTDSLGNYTLRVDTGSYTIEQIIPAHQAGLIKQICPVDPPIYTLRFTTSQDTITGKDFATQTALQSYLSVNVSSDRRRRCFTNTSTISYCNSGTAEAADAKVYVKLPEYVVFKSASAAYTVDKDSNYVFSIGILPANGCGSISIQDSVICGNSSIRGLTQCTKAWITPANSRTPSGTWDQSDISLKAKCLDNGRVRLAIYNSGNGHMADSSAFRIYFDAQLVFKANYKLAKGDSLILQVPVNGKTLRLEADQPPLHPTRIQSHVTVEACGTNNEGTVSKGYVNQQPQEEEEPEIATECLPIIDSFDPNDKLVSPQGVTTAHYTPTGAALNYKIRFQNTGTDVAYKVVVVDTLSEHLDISTLKIETVSHPYKLSITGKGKPVLTFTFNNILLPDSNTNEAKSHGYISLSIKPKKGLAEKTHIENFADIFFDFNEPVRTNTTFNTIYDMPVVVAEEAKLTEQVICHKTNISVYAGGDRIVCDKDTVVMHATAPLHGKGRWKLLSGSGQIQDAENPYSLVKDLAYGENIFEWRISANTCGTDSLNKKVSIVRVAKPATPIISQLGADSLTCNLQASTYEWLLNGNSIGVNSQTIKVSGSGSYSIRITDQQGCSSAWSVPFVSVPTGISPDLVAQVHIHPNPSNGYFIISLAAGLGNKVQITITDAIGRVVYEQTVIHSNSSDYTKELNLSSEASGMYVIKVFTGKGMIVKKVMKR